MKKLQKRVFEIIQCAGPGDIASRFFDSAIVFLIVLSVIAIMIDTFPLSVSAKAFVRYMDTAAAVVFSLEYLLRIWTAPCLYPRLSPAGARLRYMISFMALIDLLAVLPFYLPRIFPLSLQALRLLRLGKLLEVFKINRYTDALKTVASVFKRKSSQLLSSMFVILLLIVLASTLMFHAEHSVQPDKFRTILDSLWWSIATFTTVGYGDIYPVTSVGRFLSAILAFLGIVLVAVPTGIISAGFIEQQKNDPAEEEEAQYCPYCGKKLK